MPRHAIGDHAMSAAERQQRRRDKAKAARQRVTLAAMAENRDITGSAARQGLKVEPTDGPSVPPACTPPPVTLDFRGMPCASTEAATPIAIALQHRLWR